LKSLFHQHLQQPARVQLVLQEQLVQLVQQVRQPEGELERQRALPQQVQVCSLQLVQ
jgi:hypothetical protein